MKILMVSMFSPHFFNWTEQLKDSGHDIYWLDIYDSNTFVEKIDFVEQIIGWRYKWDYPGRYRIKKSIPLLDNFFRKINERNIHSVFKKKLDKIKPDVVHSFVMYSACVPILDIMKKYSQIKWIYSSWGNDLYYYQRKRDHLYGIKNVLPNIDYMFSDCHRDIRIAFKFGFYGKPLGVFPGGGGYDCSAYQSFIKEYDKRDIILIKGYQHKFGRCNRVLEALRIIHKKLDHYKVVVFAANDEVIQFAKKTGLQNLVDLEVKERIGQNEVLKLMGASSIYIGNSISDGMPNTLLEAVIMEVFPIQSNPGGATAEIIEDGKNGFLIQDPEDSNEIAEVLTKAIENDSLRRSAIEFNTHNVKPKLERSFVKEQVLGKYKLVEKSLVSK